ncbi:MAG: B12-binding domain-containing radical SAM protein [Bacteriovoracia bacterium]
MKICFVVVVNPEIEKSQMFGIRYMPVWAYTLTSYLRDNNKFEISLHDTRIKSEKKIPKADIYFYSALNQDIMANIAIANKLRSRFPESLHAIGGPATFSLFQTQRLNELKSFDGIYIGDGEKEISTFITQLCDKSRSRQLIYKCSQRFKLADARELDFALLSQSYQDYYGGVIEVSRGCPFLCEFCDIRTLPDNNRAHNKSITSILADLQNFHKLGITNILFACDNFIGDPNWANELIDAILKFQNETGFRPVFYTWLTINISTNTKLMEKMKRCGFDMFFIGVESFSESQLLETAKIQNTKLSIEKSIRTIHSYGIIVVAGLIFGFDTDEDNVIDVALKGITDSGLISGDPTLLTALAGTPLYRRMELAGRLRPGKVALGGHKYSTNIRYLREKNRIISDYIRFAQTFNSPIFQYKRFESFLNCFDSKATNRKNYRGSYINLSKLFRLIFKNPRAIYFATQRFARFFVSLPRLGAIFSAAFLMFKKPNSNWSHFYFWLFNWSNSVVKYDRISTKDFDIESIETAIVQHHILPERYADEIFEPIPLAKIKAQRKITLAALSEFIQSKKIPRTNNESTSL